MFLLTSKCKQYLRTIHTISSIFNSKSVEYDHSPYSWTSPLSSLMEKFTTWQDISGVNPFLPSSFFGSKRYSKKFLSVILKLPLVFIRAPIFIFLFIFSIYPLFLIRLGIIVISIENCSLYGSALILLLFEALLCLLKREIEIFFGTFIVRVLLGIVGIIIKEERIESKDRVALLNCNTLHLFSSLANKDELIVSNYTSFIEVVYLLVRSRPKFLRIAEGGEVEKVSLVRALHHACCNISPVVSGSKSKVHTETKIFDLSKSKEKGPFAFFPESAKTNGNGILKFPKEASKILIGSKLRIVAFSYISPPGVYRPVHPVGSFILHFLYLCMCTSITTMNVRIIPTSTSTPQNLSQPIVYKDCEEVRATMSHLIQSPMLSLDWRDSKSFGMYWTLLSEGRKKEAAEYAYQCKTLIKTSR